VSVDAPGPAGDRAEPLHGVTEAFAGVSSREEAARALASCVRDVLGPEAAPISVYLVDAPEALRPVVVEEGAGQGALAPAKLDDRVALQEEMRKLQEAAEALVMARTEHDVVDAALDLFGVAHHGPLAVWLSADRLWQEVVGTSGVHPDAEAELLRRLGDLPQLDEEARGRLAEDFARITGSVGADVMECGRATVVLGDVAPSARWRIRRFASMVAATFGSLSIVAKAERKERELAFGLASTAHELRRPVQGTRAAIEEVMETLDEADAGMALLRQSKEELEHASDMVEALLQWSADGPLRPGGDVDLSQIAHDAARGFSVKSRAALVVVDTPGSVEVAGDRTSLRVAIENLISNAISNSPENGSVLVLVTADETTARVEVRDAGPGVAEEIRDSIFDPFVRGEGRYGGSGLGLFIARRIVEGHGGEIRLESSDWGSTFTIRLPRRVADGAGARHA
jgi:signal transduction histidine kinase